MLGTVTVKETQINRLKAGFDKRRLFYTQEDYGLFQCSVPCCQITCDNREIIGRMVKEQKDMRIRFRELQDNLQGTPVQCKLYPIRSFRIFAKTACPMVKPPVS